MVCLRLSPQAAEISLFTGSKCMVRRSDGVLVTVATSPYPLMLYGMVNNGQWDKATRLCRFIKVGGPPCGWRTAVGQVQVAFGQK